MALGVRHADGLTGCVIDILTSRLQELDLTLEAVLASYCAVHIDERAASIELRAHSTVNERIVNKRENKREGQN